MDDERIDWSEIGYTDEDDFLSDYLGLNEDYDLDDFFDSWDPD